MGQSISRIENLNYCTKLKELWLCEMNIEVIFLLLVFIFM